MLRGKVCLPPNRNVPDGLLPAHNQFPTTLNSSFASLPSRSALVLTVMRKSFGFRIEFWRSTPLLLVIQCFCHAKESFLKSAGTAVEERNQDLRDKWHRCHCRGESAR